MKKVVITMFCLSIGVFAAQAQSTPAAPAPAPAPAAAPAPPQVDPNAGKFKFVEETHDYGEVPEGPEAECDFEFTNVGKKPIVITEAHGSCGCTVPTWTKDPILPKQKGTIHVKYNTNGRVGMISKEITVNSNAQQSPMILHIRGTVKAKPAEPAPVAAPTAPATK